MMIKDDGVGFTPVGRGKLLSGGKFGLAGLQERVELINGVFNLRSKSGEGTVIQIEIPLSDTM
jgi:signal transduction histidine kinase